MRIVLLLAVLSAGAAAQQTPGTLPPAKPPSTVPAATSGSEAQTSSPPFMTPVAAYQYAMEPFNDARNAPDDLTDADKWALRIGMQRANRQCEVLKVQKLIGEDLLTLGKLCLFGQDFEPARETLIAYLESPAPQSPEVGRLLLLRAFLGLHQIAAAESQVESLLSAFPYDASIHLGFDQIDDAAAASMSADDLGVIDRLNEQQLPHILDALAAGGSLKGNGDFVDAATLVRDALRIANSLRFSEKPEDAEKIVGQVSADAASDAVVHSASNASIQNALTRYAFFQQPSPVRAFHGVELLPSGATLNRTVLLYDPNPAAHRIVRHIGKETMIRMLDDRTLVLVFSLASPASGPAINKILVQFAKDHITSGMKVVAVTSWAANLGVDVPDPAALAALRVFRATLPAKLPVLIVPDSDLHPFAIDRWPAALLVSGKGRVLWLNTLSGSDGSIRQMEREMESAATLQLPDLN
ncbi:MAG: hypothetical protein WA374_14725 [Acidobacteriaceae bacterium]